MQASTHVKFRITILFFAALLGLQSIWLTLSELSRGGVDRLPTDLSTAAAAAGRRDRAALAAEIGAIRGDLWAQSAFTYADLLLGEHEEVGNVEQKLTLARVNLERALKDAPVQSGAWLLRAGLGQRYPYLGFDTMKSLKMSYYTGPSEQDLIPLRLRLTALSNAIGDVEIREFVGRDLRLLVARKQQSAIVEAYNAASPPVQRFIEQTLGDIDRPAAESLRSGAQKHPLPD
jgi:hypothetical protein